MKNLIAVIATALLLTGCTMKVEQTYTEDDVARIVYNVMSTFGCMPEVHDMKEASTHIDLGASLIKTGQPVEPKVEQTYTEDDVARIVYNVMSTFGCMPEVHDMKEASTHIDLEENLI